MVVGVVLVDVARLSRDQRVMPQESHRLARAMEPGALKGDATKEQGVVTGHDLLGISASGSHRGGTKHRARTDSSTVAEYPRDRGPSEWNEAIERATLLAQVVTQAIGARGDGGRLLTQRRRCPLEKVRRPAVVGVEEGDQGGIADLGKTCISRRCRTPVRLTKQRHVKHAAAVANPCVNAVSGAVRRTIVHDHHGLRDAGLCPDALQAIHDKAGAIPDRDNDCDGEARCRQGVCAGHGGSGSESSSGKGTSGYCAGTTYPPSMPADFQSESR